MTAVVVLEHAQLDDVVRVSPQAAGIGESTVYLRAGEELTVAELLRATLDPERERRGRGARASRRRRICRSFRRADERESRRARPLRHALREPARPRRGRARLERARRDDARALRARRPVHPRCALALERLASRRPDVPDDRRPARELGAARRRKDRAHARRGLVAGGGRRARRRRRSTARCSEATRASARNDALQRAPHVRARPVPRACR